MQPRVLVTDAHERALLATIRCLAAAGFKVTATANSLISPGLWSTATRRRRVIAGSGDGSAAFVEQLERTLRTRRHELLIPGTDLSLLAISRHRDRLEPLVRVALPEHAVIERVLNRAEVSAAASAVGLEPPDERLCADAEAALEAASELGYPVVVKPVEVVTEVPDGALRRNAAALIHDPDTLSAHVASLGQCIVQRAVPDPIVSFGGVMSSDGLLACAVSRYERTWPADAGSACFSRSIPPPAELVDRVQRLVSELRWEGMFEVELIELEGGHYGAIDFNPRPYGSLALADGAGAPIPAIWCQWALGGHPARRDARAGVGYRWEDADIRYAAWQLRRGRRRCAFEAVRPRRSVEHAYLSARDPLPAVVRATQLLLRVQEKALIRRAPSHT